jgi:hypothetical protein
MISAQIFTYLTIFLKDGSAVSYIDHITDFIYNLMIQITNNENNNSTRPRIIYNSIHLSLIVYHFKKNLICLSTAIFNSLDCVIQEVLLLNDLTIRKI